MGPLYPDYEPDVLVHDGRICVAWSEPERVAPQILVRCAAWNERRIRR